MGVVCVCVSYMTFVNCVVGYNAFKCEAFGLAIHTNPVFPSVYDKNVYKTCKPKPCCQLS